VSDQTQTAAGDIREVVRARYAAAATRSAAGEHDEARSARNPAIDGL
jgi:hypothetical protein